MRVFIKTLQGETVTMEVEPTDSVDQLKTHLQELQGTPIRMQSLVFNGLFSPHTLFSLPWDILSVLFQAENC